MSNESKANGRYVIGWDDFPDEFKTIVTKIDNIQEKTKELENLDRLADSMESIDKKIFYLILLFAFVYAIQAVSTVLKQNGHSLKIPNILELGDEKK